MLLLCRDEIVLVPGSTGRYQPEMIKQIWIDRGVASMVSSGFQQPAPAAPVDGAGPAPIGSRIHRPGAGSDGENVSENVPINRREYRPYGQLV